VSATKGRSQTARRLEGRTCKNKRGKREERERGGRSADSSYSDSSHVPAVAGRPAAGPPGGLCHVAAAKTKQKEKEGATGRERDRKSDYSQRRCNGAAKGERRGREGWRWVNSGEILLVSVKDGPWSALVSWRRRGFSRASPVPNGVVESEFEGAGDSRKVVGRECERSSSVEGWGSVTTWRSTWSLPSAEFRSASQF